MTALDMRPVDAAYGAANRHLSDAVFLREGLLRDTAIGIAATDLQYQRLCQFCSRGRFAARNTFRMSSRSMSVPASYLTGFCFRSVALSSCAASVVARPVSVAGLEASAINRVLNVIGLRARSQVRRANTGRSVARVQDEHAFRDWADCQLIGDAMSVDISPLPSRLAVARNALGSAPQPTVTALVNLSPEPPDPCFMSPQDGAST